MSETPLESAPEDVAEQRVDAYPDELEVEAPQDVGGLGLEADPADAQEQATPAPLDEDDWA